jgi:hypothetical protein
MISLISGLSGTMDKEIFCKKKCIDKIIVLANEEGLRPDFQTWDDALVVFNAVYDKLLRLAYGEKVPSRPNQIAYTTIGRNIKADS